MRRVIFLLFLGLAAAAPGAELPPPISPADFIGASAALPETTGWFWSFIALPEVSTGILGALSLAAGMLLRWRRVETWRLARAVQCLAAGVRETYEEYVREIQKCRSGGKLTAEERDRAMRMALDKAMAYARREGVDLAKVYAKEFLPVVVERLIGVQKAAGRGLPFASLLPELAPR